MQQIINEQLNVLANPVVMAIMLVALFSYGKLFQLCFFNQHSQQWQTQARYWFDALKKIVSTLPLLGLLGTISGLLASFLSMKVNNGLDMQEIVSGGIADAMFTTQLGLIMVIPALLLLTLLRHNLKTKAMG